MAIFISILVLLIIGIVLMMIKENKENAHIREEIQRLYLVYIEALKGKDRRAALRAGRLYFSLARKGGSPTAYDEQSMANDLNTMPMEIFSSTLEARPKQDLAALDNQPSS
jgi:hypothetical protein